MIPVAEQRSIQSPTGRLSQQSQPSAHGNMSFEGGYLSPVGHSTPRLHDSTGTVDNASSANGSTRPDALPDASQRIVAPVVRLPRPTSRARLKPVQHWEGVVEAISDGSFMARLHDYRRPGRLEEAEFPLSDVADGDLELLAVGAVFYWTIGYLITPGGQRTRTSTIRFRRIPGWTEQELHQAETRAAETRRLLDWA